MSKVAIVTTHYRNTEKFYKCITKVLEKTKNVEYNWYIWCNDPNEKVIDTLNSFNDNRLNIYYHPNNYGSFSSNNNACIRRSSEEYILLLNDDVEPINENWLEKMLDIIAQDESVGIVGANLIYQNGLIQHAGVIFDEATNGLPYHIYYRQKQNKVMVYNREYQIVTGACMLFRRSDWETVGGLDEDYWYMYEDCDFCLKIHSLNKKIIYCGQAKLIHHEGISGAAKNNPKANDNIKIFRNKWSKKIVNDHKNYLENHNYKIYRR